MAGDIANVNKLEPTLQSGFSGSLQSRYRGWGQTFQLVQGIKPAKVQRHIRPQFILDPLAHGSHLVHVVILARYHQVHDLSMNAQAIPMIKKVVRMLSMEEARADLQDILQLRTAEEVREFIVNRMKPIITELDEKGFYLKVS